MAWLKSARSLRVSSVEQETGVSVKLFLPWVAVVTVSAANTAKAQDQSFEKDAAEREIVVTGYADPVANTATKTDTPIMMTPFTIEVLPRQLLDDQGITSSGLARALRNVGVSTQGSAPTTEGFNFRGFYSTVNLWNGMRIEDFSTTGGPGWGGVWTDNVDRIEVLKGPSSVLYGRNEPGGTVNIVTKRPTAEHLNLGRLTVGSLGQLSVAGDIGGPLNGDSTILFRANVAKERSDSFYLHDPAYKSLGVSGALEWKATPETTFVVEGLFRSMQGAAGGQGMPLDPDTNLLIGPFELASLKGNLSKVRQARFFAIVQHEFGAGWSATLRAIRTTAFSPELSFDFLYTGYFPESSIRSLAIDRMLARTDNSRRKLTAFAFDLQGKISTFGIDHTVLLGGDYYSRKASFTSFFSCCHPTDYYNQSTVTPDQYVTAVDGFDPLLSPGFATSGDSLYRNRDYAFYLQDQLFFPGSFSILFGGRVQLINEKTASNNEAGNGLLSNPEIRRTAFSPRAGIVWNPLNWFSIYYSYSENIGSNNAFAFPNRPLDPEETRQHEAGVKGEWFGGKLNATLAVFELVKKNVATEDFDHPGFVLPIGKVRSRGFEVNLQGALSEHFNLIANVSHSRPEVVESSGVLPTGSLLPYLPNTTANLWATWELPSRSVRGVRIGAGLDWASRGNLFPGHSLSAPSYFVASVFASHSFEIGGQELFLQLNVDNIFNKRYFNSLDGQRDFGIASVALGYRRRAQLTLKLAL